MLISYISGVKIHSTRACRANQRAMLLTSIPEDSIYIEGCQNELSTKEDEELLRATAKAHTPVDNASNNPPSNT